MLSEQEALRQLQNGEVRLAPLSLQLMERQSHGKGDLRLDAVVRIQWRGRCYDFGIEYKPYSTPRMFQAAVNQAISCSRPEGVYPMVMAPYLSEEQLRQLEEKGISGVDLCGNGIVQVPGELFVFRTGAPNRFPSSAPIKNIYRGKSSLVARVFLARPTYPSVNEILHEIWRRGADLRKKEAAVFKREPRTVQASEEEHERQTKVALSTVSKALKTLEQDLIVGRESGIIRLLQPEKLLDKLVENYRPPEVRVRYSGEFMDSEDIVIDRLYNNLWNDPPLWPGEMKWAVTGTASVNVYGIMARENMTPFYCSDIRKLLRGDVRIKEARRFPDIELIETEDETVYFDRRSTDTFKEQSLGSFYWQHMEPFYVWASPVQTYLELMAGDKRDQETAEQVKRFILAEIERQAA